MKRLARWTAFGADSVGAVMFAAMFLTFLLQIFMRYVVGEPLSWTIELCGILYVAIVLWGAAFLVRERDHITFTLVTDAVAPPVRRALAVVAAVALIASFVTALPGTLDYTEFMAGKKTPIMRITYLSVYGLFPVFMVAMIVRYAVIGLRAAAGRPG